MNRLKMLRIEQGITQDELAGKLKINRNAISRYENGKRQPDYEILKKIADYFSVSIDYLLDRESPNPSPEISAQALNLMQTDHKMQELYANINDLSEEESRKIIDYISFVKSQRI